MSHFVNVCRNRRWHHGRIIYLPGNQKRFATSAHNFGRVVSPVVSWPFLRAILPYEAGGEGS
jgi:hypothetical protein